MRTLAIVILALLLAGCLAADAPAHASAKGSPESLTALPGDIAPRSFVVQHAAFVQAGDRLVAAWSGVANDSRDAHTRFFVADREPGQPGFSSSREVTVDARLSGVRDVAARADGALALLLGGANGFVQVLSSNDAGASWRVSGQVPAPLGADVQAARFVGSRLLVLSGTSIVASDDLGASWAPPVELRAPSGARAASFAMPRFYVAPGDDVWVLWTGFQGQSEVGAFEVSRDGGRTFTLSPLSQPGAVPTLAFSNGVPVYAWRTLGPSLSRGVSASREWPANGTASTRLDDALGEPGPIAYAAGDARGRALAAWPENDGREIRIATSTDEGRTFGSERSLAGEASGGHALFVFIVGDEAVVAHASGNGLVFATAGFNA